MQMNLNARRHNINWIVIKIKLQKVIDSAVIPPWTVCPFGGIPCIVYNAVTKHFEDIAVLTVYIDADGCPVKDEVYKVAVRYQLPVKVVANKYINVPLNSAFQMVVVSAGPDEADNWIAEHIDEADICITSDIPLADRCLKKKARVLGFRGDEFTDNMIGNALATRALMQELREIGQMTGGPAPFSPRDKSQFLSNLDRIIQAIKRNTNRNNW